MKPFHEMLRRVTCSSYHSQMQKMVEPLARSFGINHFWYYSITNEGHYSYLGSHAAWSEFCFDRSLVECFPCLRHPSLLKSGIHLMKAANNSIYQNTLTCAWEKFRVNFCLNLQTKTARGIEAYGFATHYNDPQAEERLLNELALLKQFTGVFRERLRPLFSLLEDNQVSLAEQFGSRFFESERSLQIPCNRELLLRQLGFAWINLLTLREKDILNYLASCFSASYIAHQLHLSIRTVENYIATLKSKLNCTGKVALIQKAKEFTLLAEAHL